MDSGEIVAEKIPGDPLAPEDPLAQEESVADQKALVTPTPQSLIWSFSRFHKTDQIRPVG